VGQVDQSGAARHDLLQDIRQSPQAIAFGFSGASVMESSKHTVSRDDIPGEAEDVVWDQ
jgi:hypothetical protein